MIKLGITGGIGSGKSTICKLFSLLGIPIYESDAQAKNLMNNSPVINERLLSTFGNTIYREDGNLDRKKLAHIVFNSPYLLKELNNIVHPEVRRDFLCWAEKQKDAPYVIQESAILFNSGFNQIMDKTLTVTAPITERINRVIARDLASKEQVLERINNQMNDEQQIALSDYVIHNGSNDLLIVQVLKIDQILRNG